MRAKVALVGCRGAVLRARSWDVVRLVPDAIYRDSLAGFFAVVLGADAIESLDPVLAWSALAAVRSRVVLCAEVRHPYDVLRPWTACGFGDPPPPAGLPARVAALDRRHVRPWLEHERWLPCLPGRDSPAGAAVAVVFHLDRFNVDAWIARLRWSEGRLQRACRTAFGISAKRVLWRYVARAYLDLRDAGATDEECVVALAHSDSKSLHRALASAAEAEQTDAAAVRIAQVSSSNRPVQLDGSPLS